MLGVPLRPVPAQIVSVALAGQACTIRVYQKFFGLFCDLLVDNEVIIQGVLCQHQNFVVRSLYLGFVGDLMFFDTQGTEDPSYTGLGDPQTTRWVLVYVEQSELPDDYGQNPYDPDAISDLFLGD